jgi:branched-chain amino acid transport system permease protein
MGAITLRLRGVYFTIFTFGLVELLKNLILWTEIRFTGRRGRFVRSTPVDVVYYYLLALAVILIIAAFIIKRTRFGKALASIGESEDAAAHIGVNTTLVKLIAFAISSFFMGAVGAAMATRNAYIDPGIAFDTLKSFLPVLMVIFGGTRTLAGPVVGAAVFAYLQELLITDQILSSWYRISIGAIMIIALLFMPEGLLGLGENIFYRIVKRVRRAGRANT